MTQNRRFRSHSPWLFAALAAGLLTGCQKQTDAGETSLTDAKKREPVKVLVEPVVRRETVRHLETTTRVESEHHVELMPRAAGVLVELLVEEGDHVTVGQVLARLDDRETRIALLDAETALTEAQASLPTLEVAVHECDSRLETAKTAADQARKDHERNLAISRGGKDGPQLLSAKDLDASALALEQAEGEVTTTELAKKKALLDELGGDNAIERARLALDRTELMLSFMEITAPISGVIAERRVNVGDALTSAAPAFVLTDPDQLRAVFYRPQRELRLFRSAAGTPASDANGSGTTKGLLEISAEADGLAGRTFRGWIERISPTVDAASGNFRVTARLETGEPPDRLLAGMLVRLDIVTERHADSLVVPKRAIRREGDRSVIFLVEDGLARELEVEEGFTDEDHVEVTPVEGELAEGALVVVVGNRDLEPGAEVTIRDGHAQAEPEDEPNDEPAEAAPASESSGPESSDPTKE
jgi:membrane fusion protein (multidrug efflux system)